MNLFNNITFMFLFLVIDNYCILEVDSYGHFFRKAKTKPARGPEPGWDEVFNLFDPIQ